MEHGLLKSTLRLSKNYVDLFAAARESLKLSHGDLLIPLLTCKPIYMCHSLNLWNLWLVVVSCGGLWRVVVSCGELWYARINGERSW